MLSVSAGGCRRAGLLSRRDRQPPRRCSGPPQSPALLSWGKPGSAAPRPFPPAHTTISCPCRRLEHLHSSVTSVSCVPSTSKAYTVLVRVSPRSGFFVHSFTQQTHFQGPSRLSGWIAGSGRSPGEGREYPLQNSWTSLVPQLVKNPPAMREAWF